MAERIVIFRRTEKEIKNQLRHIDGQLHANTSDLRGLDMDGDMTDDPILYTLKGGRERLIEEKLKLESSLRSVTGYTDQGEVSRSDNIQRGHAITLHVTHPDKYEEDMEITIGSKLDGDFLAKSGVISDETPLGKALIGKKEGENVVYQTPTGAGEAKIRKVSVSSLIKP